MYCKMLNESVQQMKGEQKEEDSFKTSIDLSLDAYIPSSYVPNESQKLELYKRISYIETQEEYEDMTDELTDRYGEVPAPLIRLMDAALLKQEAHEAWILSIEQKGTEIFFTMNPHARVKVDRIDAFLKGYHGKMRVKPALHPVFIYDPGVLPKKELFSMVKDVIFQIKHLLE